MEDSLANWKDLASQKKIVILTLSYLSNRRTATTIGNNTSSVTRKAPNVDLYTSLPTSTTYSTSAFWEKSYCIPVMQLLHMLLLQEWLNRNVLTLNASKTKYMTFGRVKNSPDFNIIYDGEYVGLIIDENLSLKNHVDHVNKLIVPFISFMWRNGKLSFV